MNTVDATELPPERLVELIVAAKRALYPEASIVGGEFECSQCREKGVPALIEDGMTVTHDLVTISPVALRRIRGRGHVHLIGSS